MEPRPTPHLLLLLPLPPTRGLAVLPELGMLVSGHRDGLLHVWPLPTPRMHLLPLPAARPPAWALRHGSLRAHRTRMSAMDRWGRVCVGWEGGCVCVRVCVCGLWGFGGAGGVGGGGGGGVGGGGWGGGGGGRRARVCRCQPKLHHTKLKLAEGDHLDLVCGGVVHSGSVTVATPIPLSALHSPPSNNRPATTRLLFYCSWLRLHFLSNHQCTSLSGPSTSPAPRRCGTRLATGSETGGVKVWDVLDLRSRAMRQVRQREGRRRAGGGGGG